MPEVLDNVRSTERDEYSSVKPYITLKSETPGLNISVYIYKKNFFDNSNNCYLLTNGIYVKNFSFFPVNSRNWIVMIDCSIDLIDLNVSREDLMKNKKYTIFLSKIYEGLLNAISNEIGTIDNFDDPIDYCKQHTMFLNFLFQSDFGVDEKEVESQWVHYFYSNKIFPTLYKSGLTYLTLYEIIAKEHFHLIHYKMPLELCKEHIETFSNFLFSDIDENEAVIFDIGPRFSFIEYDPRKFNCALCEIVSRKDLNNIECTNLSTMLEKKHYKKEITPLDSILYGKSYFTIMPEILRSFTIQIKPFEFKPNIDEASLPLTLRSYSYFVTMELFHDESEISAFYKKIHSVFEEDRTLLLPGKFVYDLEDPFTKHLISKAEDILQNNALKEIVTLYYKSLALCSVSKSYEFGRLKISFNEINLALMEKILAYLLNYSENYITLEQRMSKYGCVFLLAV